MSTPEIRPCKHCGRHPKMHGSMIRDAEALSCEHGMEAMTDEEADAYPEDHYSTGYQPWPAVIDMWNEQFGARP